MKSVLWIYNN